MVKITLKDGSVKEVEAGKLVIEFAKPVIGTIVPAPAKTPILSKTPKPVNKLAININTIRVQPVAISTLIVLKIAISISVIA